MTSILKPATRTELEARAAGHYPDEVHISDAGFSIRSKSDRIVLDGTTHNWGLPKANVAFAYLAWTSYAPMRAALEAARDHMLVNGPDDFDATLAVIDAALRAARGEKT